MIPEILKNMGVGQGECDYIEFHLCSLHTPPPPAPLTPQQTEHLVSVLQVLGSHSIGAAELKLLIGALRPLEGGELPTYYFRLQRALSIMASDIGREGAVPLYYFDLRKNESVSNCNRSNGTTPPTSVVPLLKYMALCIKLYTQCHDRNSSAFYIILLMLGACEVLN